jgi:hypothetical protein
MAIITDNRPKVESTLNGVEMTIDTSSRFVYEQYIKIYENKYSFLREITANAFDAVIELWERDYIDTYTKADFLAENPIVLGVYKDASGHYISIKETKGIGMSPERMREYLKITNSTKRESEHQIGAKGIGRLSALAYQNEYYIETVYDGIKYFYMVDFYNNAPKITSTYDMPTDEPNHTKVKIYVVDFDHEKRYIEEYIQTNLSYFENLVVEQLKFDYNLNKYEDKDFYYLYKEVSSVANYRSHQVSYINILLGSIPYQVSRSSLKLSSNESNLFEETLAYQKYIIKFNVSDLDVVASRDTLSMTDRTVEALRDRLFKVIADIQKLQDIVFSELWNSSPQDPNSFKLLNILFRDGNLIYKNLFFDRNTKLTSFQNNSGIRRSFRDWFSEQNYEFTKFDGNGSKPKQYNLRVGDSSVVLISDSKLPVKHRKNKYIIFEDTYYVNRDITDLKKFIRVKSSAEFIEEDRVERALNKEDKISEKNEVYCYLYNSGIRGEVTSKATFKEIIDGNTDKVIYHALYNRETKNNWMNIANVIVTVEPNCIIFLTTENNANRMKKEELQHINTIPLNVNKIADSYLFSIIHDNASKYLCISSDSVNFDNVLRDIMQKHNWKNSQEAWTYYENIKGLHSKFYSDKVELQFAIKFGKADYTPELYDIFYDCSVNIKNVGKEYPLLFTELETYIKAQMMIGYLSLHWYTSTTIDLDVLEVKQKVLNLYPKSEEIISFDFDEVDIVNKVNN